METENIIKENPSRKFYEIVIRQVPLQFTNELLNQDLKHQHENVISAWRILAYPNRTPTRFIRVRMKDQNTYKHMLDNGCIINGQIFKTELLKKERHVVSRCYNCHEIGLGVHHAKNCLNKTRCLICSGWHHQSDCKSKTECCTNCEMAHRANSVDCPIWKKHTRIGKMENDNSTKYDVICLLNNLDTNHEETTQLLMQILTNQQLELTKIKHTLQKMNCAPGINSKSVISGEEGECSKSKSNIDQNNIDKLFKPYIDSPTAVTSSTSCDIFDNMKLSEFDTAGLEDFVKINTENRLQYRFEKGCKVIKVLHQRSNRANREKPCPRPLSEVKTLQSEFISCCPFHFLSAHNRESINKLKNEIRITDFTKSLYSWRTFSL